MLRNVCLAGVMAALWAMAACGDEDPPSARQGVGNNDAGADEDEDEDRFPDARIPDPNDMEDEDVVTGDALAPVPSVVEPFTREDLESFDVDTDPVIIDPRVTVVCEVAKNEMSEDDVDPSSVRVTIESLDPDALSVVEADANPQPDGSFRATANIENLPAGGLRITCLANDRATPSRLGETVTFAYFDRGPAITLVRPESGAAFAGSDLAVAEFTVEGAPLTEDDQAGAEVTATTFTVNGRELPEGLITRNGTSYSFDLDFDDTAYFTPGITSASIEARATNGRAPTPATSTLRVPLTVDDIGPTIEFTTLVDSQIAAGEVNVEVRIEDAESEVDPSTVRVEIANGGAVSMTQLGGGIYQHIFASGTYNPRSKITVEVTASDLAGNEASQEIQLFLDNVAPWASLDPPTMRAREVGLEDNNCTPEFDPLGGAILGGPDNQSPWGFPAVNDGDTVAEQAMIRAFVYDRTNDEVGASSVRFSGVQEVELWLQRDPTVDLLIDTNGDGICDDINVDPGTGMANPTLFQLEPLEPANFGNRPIYTAQTFDGFDPVLETSGLGPPPYGGCVAAGGDPVFDSPEIGECGRAPMFTLKHQVVSANIGVIYAYNPDPLTSAIDCRGQTVPFQIPESNFSDWVCLAVRATDQYNRTVSAPLRLCVDKNNGGTDCESVDPPPPCHAPNCTLPVYGSDAFGGPGDGGPKDIPSDVPRTINYL